MLLDQETLEEGVILLRSWFITQQTQSFLSKSTTPTSAYSNATRIGLVRDIAKSETTALTRSNHSKTVLKENIYAYCASICTKKNDSEKNNEIDASAGC